MARALAKELAELRPEVVYGYVGNYPLTRSVVSACRTLGLPLYLHVTDDFASSLYRGRPLASKLVPASERWFRRAVQQADGLAAISPFMAREFSGRYGGDWTWFTTLVDAAVHDPTPPPPHEKIRLVYAGGLGLERWRALSALGHILARRNGSGEIRTELSIYCPSEEAARQRGALEEAAGVEVRGWVSPEHLPDILHGADLLLHVESSDPALVEYTRLSFSTKLSQYLMAGRCIVGLGPARVESLSFLNRIGAGVHLDPADCLEEREELEQVLTQEEARLRKGRAGRKWAEDQLEVRAGRDRFLAELLDAIRRHRGS
jgi:hypothetical protein